MNRFKHLRKHRNSKSRDKEPKIDTPKYKPYDTEYELEQEKHRIPIHPNKVSLLQEKFPASRKTRDGLTVYFNLKQDLFNLIKLDTDQNFQSKKQPEQESTPLYSQNDISHNLVRCHQCKAQINLQCRFYNDGSMWKCSLCQNENQTPSYYFSALDGYGIRKDVDKLDELRYGEYTIVLEDDGNSSLRIIIAVQLFKADKMIILETLKKFLQGFENYTTYEKVQCNIVLFSDIVQIVAMEKGEFKFQTMDETHMEVGAFNKKTSVLLSLNQPRSEDENFIDQHRQQNGDSEEKDFCLPVQRSQIRINLLENYDELLELIDKMDKMDHIWDWDFKDRCEFILINSVLCDLQVKRPGITLLIFNDLNINNMKTTKEDYSNAFYNKLVTNNINWIDNMCRDQNNAPKRHSIYFVEIQHADHQQSKFWEVISLRTNGLYIGVNKQNHQEQNSSHIATQLWNEFSKVNATESVFNIRCDKQTTVKNIFSKGNRKTGNIVSLNTMKSTNTIGVELEQTLSDLICDSQIVQVGMAFVNTMGHQVTRVFTIKIPADNDQSIVTKSINMNCMLEYYCVNLQKNFIANVELDTTQNQLIRSFKKNSHMIGIEENKKQLYEDKLSVLLPHQFQVIYRFLGNLFELKKDNFKNNKGIFRCIKQMDAFASQNVEIIYPLIYPRFYTIWSDYNLRAYQQQEIEDIFDSTLELRQEQLKQKLNMQLMDQYQSVLILADWTQVNDDVQDAIYDNVEKQVTLKEQERGITMRTDEQDTKKEVVKIQPLMSESFKCFDSQGSSDFKAFLNFNDFIHQLDIV